jgi:hypothetical protein
MKDSGVRLLLQRFPPSGIAPPSNPPVVNPETALVPPEPVADQSARPVDWDRLDCLEHLEFLEGR